VDKKPLAIRSSVLEYTVPKPDADLEVPMTFRVSKQTKHLITLMLRDARDQLAWLTPADFLRWATHAGLGKVLADLKNKRLKNMFVAIESSLEVLREQEYQKAYLKLIQETRNQVKSLDDCGAQNQVPKMLREVKSKLDSMEPGFWPDKVKKQFEAEFGSRLRSDKISPRPRDAQKDEGEDDE
jgi:hypothetical protein